MRSNFWKRNEEGSATIIALLIMVLLLAFVALAVSRTTTETLATGNDATESRTFSAAQASLENATREFDQIFERKLTPSAQDIEDVVNAPNAGFDDEFDILPEIEQISTTSVAPAGSFLQGLTALRDEWRIDTTVKHKTTGVEVKLSRKFFNDRVPIFQFGIFYNDDLEFHPGPRFDFGGRVHSNANLFLAASTGLYFSSKVSAFGHIVTDVARNGSPSTDWGNNVYVRNGSGTYIKLDRLHGSALNSVTNGTNIFNPAPQGQLPLPAAYRNASWGTYRDKFDGNLLSEQKKLDLPLRISSVLAGQPMDYIELIRRGKMVGDRYKSGGTNAVPIISNVTAANADGPITVKERYANKAGIRISLANSQDRLPGCANAPADDTLPANRCGVRLDGNLNGRKLPATVPGAVSTWGYQPMTLRDGTINTRFNAVRMDTTKQDWIKIEMVQVNPDTSEVTAVDITEDLLAFGITERAPRIPATGAGTNPAFEMVTNATCVTTVTGYCANADARSILKFQRYVMNGTNAVTVRTAFTRWMSMFTNSGNYNLVTAGLRSNTTTDWGDVNTYDGATTNASTTNKDGIVKTARFCPTSGSASNCFTRSVAPFPIRMFDTREGLYNEGININNTYGNPNRIPLNGAMGLIDVDINNLRQFLMGTWDNLTPNVGTKFSTANARGLRAADVPTSNGWVLYISDRRGDHDFDGEYDGEDIYGNNDGILQPGEDINRNGVLDTNYVNEAPMYTANQATYQWDADRAAVIESPYFRRGVRLINGTTIPGNYDLGAVNPAVPTRGFTFASENGVYVKGNYNATGITTQGNPTPPENYQPKDTVNHIPASVVGDTVTILSNNWEDTRSFRYPFTLSERNATETFIRFAILSGDSISSVTASPNQGGGNPRMNGGVHNFKRFLENWDNSVELHYSGSLINLYNASNNNGSFKCCAVIYAPPVRDWVFDISFMNPARLPPGTPFFQSIQLTGFQRLNRETLIGGD